MAPLLVMLALWFLFGALGWAGWWRRAGTWKDALRFALAGMFVFTAASHFHPSTRPDLVQMVPPLLPAPGFLVTATGVLELAGAVALLFRRSAPAAAWGLIALLAAMFPANVYAAREGLLIAGREASPLLWRLPLQLFWMWALWWVRRSSHGSHGR